MTALMPQRQWPTPGWQPHPLPPLGQVRSNQDHYAIYLPASPRDIAPWRILAHGQNTAPAVNQVTHSVVYSDGWVVHPPLPEILRLPTPNEAARLTPRDIRFFLPGDPCPDDLAAVVNPERGVWLRTDWSDCSPSWDDLLSIWGGLIEVPVDQLMQIAFDLQSKRGLS